MANQNLKIQITAIDRTKAAFRGIAVSLGKVQKALFSFKTAIAGVVGAAGLGLLIKSSLDSIDALGKTASKLGVTTQQLQKLRFAAEIAGVSTRTTDMAIQRFTRRLSEAAVDTGEAKDALKELGINAKELTKLPLEEQMLQLASAFEDVESSGDRVRLAFKLFDSEGVAFVNTLQNGRAELQGMFDEVDDLGLALSGRAVKGVEEANDAFTRLASVTRGVLDTLVASLAPAFTFLADEAREALIDKIGGDFKNVEAFGKTMAISVIEFFKRMSQAVIEFANIVIRNMNNVLTLFNNIKKSLKFEISEEEYQQSIDKIISSFENWQSRTVKASSTFQAEFLKIEMLLDDLRNGADLSTNDLLELADAVEDVGKGGGAIGAVANNLSALIREASRKSKKTSEDFVKLGKISLDMTGIFDGMAKALEGVNSNLDETGNNAESAGKKGVLSLSQLTDIILSIPPNLDQVNDAFKSMRISLEDVQMNGVRSLEDALVDVGTQTKSLKEAFGDMARSILRDIMRMQIRQAITIPIAQSLGLSPRAMGGPVTAGRPYLVGERGPELFVPGRTGGIVPNGQMGGGGVTVNQTINLTTGVSQTVRAEVLNMLPQIADAAKGAVLDAKRRGGSYAAALG